MGRAREAAYALGSRSRRGVMQRAAIKFHKTTRVARRAFSPGAPSEDLGALRGPFT
jgi:hypothetical protein